jgi:LysM repeat protein
MVGRSVRLMAPIAIIAVAVSVYLIVHATVDKHHTVTHSLSATTKRHHKRTRAVRSKQAYYVVQPGDTLSAIATHTGVSLTELERLNPNVSPNSLQTGQRLRLRQ